MIGLEFEFFMKIANTNWQKWGGVTCWASIVGSKITGLFKVYDSKLKADDYYEFLDKTVFERYTQETFR